jgi:hypothetical protein
VPASAVNYRFKSQRVARELFLLLVTGLVTRNEWSGFRASRMHQSGPNRPVLDSSGQEPGIAKTLTTSDYSVATRKGQDR